METILKKLIKGRKVGKKDIENALFEVCQDVHASCNEQCPVFEINGGPLDPDTSSCGCSCFKNGAAMRQFLREKL